MSQGFFCTLVITRIPIGTHIRLDDVPIEETEWSANITHNMSRMALQVPICVKYRNKEYKGTLYDYVWEPGENGNITTSIMSI